MDGGSTPPAKQQARQVSVQETDTEELPSLAAAAAAGSAAAIAIWPAVQMILIILGRIIWWALQLAAALLSFLVMLLAAIFASVFQGARHGAPQQRQEVQKHDPWSGTPRKENGITIINNNFITNQIQQK